MKTEPRKTRRVRSFLWKHATLLAFVIMACFVAVIGYAGWNYVVITDRFDSARRWDLPSRIYSDATALWPGMTLEREMLEAKLNHVGYHEVENDVSNPGEYRFVDGDLEVFLQDFKYPEMDFHGFPVRIDFSGDRITGIRRALDDVALRAVRIEPELITSIFNDVMEDREPVAYETVPEHLTNAIVAIEDRSFFRHEGISIRAIMRAAVANMRAGQITEGGSTLTQQLVKNLYLSHDRVWIRKMREAIMAIMIDARYSKEEILEAYMNEIYLGQNGSVQINGVEQASRMYFAKSVEFLTLPEAATLAGLIQSPGRYNPLRNPEDSKARRNLVLDRMLDQQLITKSEHEKASAAPLRVNRFPRAINSAPYFVDLVRQELKATYPETQLQTEGLRIFTTLDTMMQRSAESALNAGLTSLARKYRRLRDEENPLQGAVVTIQPGTGYVKALVGGRSYGGSQFNRAVQAKRQPGSLFKPFVYLAAMDPERGADALTAASILEDSPISVQTGSKAWRPQNYDGRFRGDVTVRQALTYSYNVPAVRAAIDAGVGNVIELASEIGVTSPLQPYPSISLGSFEVTPLEIAYAYSVFANGGVKAEPVSILAVATSDGRVLESRQVRMQRVAPASVTYVMNDILQDVLARGTAARTRSLGFRAPFSGKTGTTNDYRDAWFIAYSPEVLSTVWVGFDDNRSMRISGSEGAVPIWTDHMLDVVGLVPERAFRRTDDVIDRDIDPETGMLASPYCPVTRSEIFVRGTEPQSVCSLHGYERNPLDWLYERRNEPDGQPPAIVEGTEDEDAPGTPAEREEREREKRRKSRFERWLEKVF